MTAAQRRAINRRNALKSTGPKTDEGKERTRQNALKHGLRADHLVLTIENLDDLQNEFDTWIDHYQPVGPAEYAMVEEIAKSHLKLRRISRRESAVVDLQVRTAYRDWEYAQEDRVIALQELLPTDPTTAVRELKRFGHGRRWLIDRWHRLGEWFLKDGYCATPELVDEAVRLLGADPQQIKSGPLLAYRFRLCCAVARPDGNPQYVEWLLSDAAIHPEYHAEQGRSAPEPDACRREVRAIVGQQILDLEQEELDWREDEKAEAAGACLRAQIPAEGPETKIALRYESMTRLALHKALKELDRLQDQRFALETELAAEPDVATVAPNEPNTPPEPQSTPRSVLTCDACENANSDVSKVGAMPTSSWAYPEPADMPTQTWACHPPEVPIGAPEGAVSPPA